MRLLACDQFGGVFGDGNHSGVRIAPNNRWHDGRVNNTYALNAVNAQRWIDHRADTASTSRVVDRAGVPLDKCPDIGTAARRGGPIVGANNLGEVRLPNNIADHLNTGNHGAPIFRRVQKVTEYSWLRIWPARSKSNGPATS